MKILQKNKKALFDYEVISTYIAGMVLTGPEIKSVRKGQINLKGSYVSLQNGELFLKNANISHYAYDQNADYDPFRIRKLLLSKKEIHSIEQALNESGVTVVPLAIGLQGAYAKAEIATVRGKKKYDKRLVIKEREDKRRMGRMLKKF